MTDQSLARGATLARNAAEWHSTQWHEPPRQSPDRTRSGDFGPRPTRSRCGGAWQRAAASSRALWPLHRPGDRSAPEGLYPYGAATSRLSHLIPGTSGFRQGPTACPLDWHGRAPPSLQRAQPARRPRPGLTDRGRFVSIGSRCARVEESLVSCATPTRRVRPNRLQGCTP
jgi:hypothetical protein